jgi:hypothetical protein
MMEKDKYEHIGMQHVNTRILGEKRNGGETEKYHLTAVLTYVNIPLNETAVKKTFWTFTAPRI